MFEKLDLQLWMPAWCQRGPRDLMSDVVINFNDSSDADPDKNLFRNVQTIQEMWKMGDASLINTLRTFSQWSVQPAEGNILQLNDEHG